MCQPEILGSSSRRTGGGDRCMLCMQVAQTQSIAPRKDLTLRSQRPPTEVRTGNPEKLCQRCAGTPCRATLGGWFFTTTGAGAPTVQHQQKPILAIIFLENTRTFPEMITSTGAKFLLRFCLSVLVLVIFKSPIHSVTLYESQHISLVSCPRGPGETSTCREAKNAANVGEGRLSLKLPQDSWETFSAARPLDVSQGPLDLPDLGYLVSRCPPPPQTALLHLSAFDCQGCRTSSCLSEGIALYAARPSQKSA